MLGFGKKKNKDRMTKMTDPDNQGGGGNGSVSENSEERPTLKEHTGFVDQYAHNETVSRLKLEEAAVRAAEWKQYEENLKLTKLQDVKEDMDNIIKDVVRGLSVRNRKVLLKDVFNTKNLQDNYDRKRPQLVGRLELSVSETEKGPVLTVHDRKGLSMDGEVKFASDLTYSQEEVKNIIEGTDLASKAEIIDDDDWLQ